MQVSVVVSTLFFFLYLSSCSFFSPRTNPQGEKLISLTSFSLFCCFQYEKPINQNRYIAPGFVKLCKSASSGGAGGERSEEIPDIIFLKHDVERDGDGSDSDGDGEGDGGGRTSLAVALKIRSVPLFHVYRGRELVKSFATRDR